MYQILRFDWLAVRARRAYLASLDFPYLLPQEGISIFGHIICSWKIFSHVLFNARDNHYRDFTVQTERQRASG